MTPPIRRFWTLLILCVLAFSFSSEAFAAKKKWRAPRRAAKTQVTVPVNVGVGPSAFMFYGPVMDDQPVHLGFRLEVFAVIDAALIKKNIRKVPRKYRKMAKSIKGEVRIHPLWFLPRSLIISPKVKNTGIFGINFRPIGIGMPLSINPRFDISAGLLASYMYVTSDTLASPTHFLRPGLELKAELEFPVAKDFLMSLGYSSSFYPPQELGGEVFKWGEVSNSIWHIGQAFVLFHFRFPYTTKI